MIGWASIRLGEACSKIGSGATPRGGEKAYKASGTPLIRSLNVHFDTFRLKGLAFLDDHQAELLNGVAVRSSDVLLNITGASIGRVNLAPQAMDGARVNQHVCIIRPVSGVEPLFVRYFLASPVMQGFVTDENYGVTRQALTKEMIEGFTLPLPPLAEQRRIVEKIEALTARSGRAREALAALPALLNRYRAAVLAAAFRGDLTAEWREEHGRSALERADEEPPLEFLSPLPAGWSWSTVGALGNVSGGLTKNAKRAEMEFRRLYLRVANVYADELRLDDVQEIGVTDAEMNRTELQTGDLLIVEGNGSVEQIGRVAMWDGSIPGCVHQNHIIKVRFAAPVLAATCLRWLLSPSGRRCIEAVASSSSGLHTLSLSKVRDLPMPLPPADEQAVVLRKIEEALERLPRLSGVVDDATTHLSTLDSAILAKAFRGELVPQDPNDEPALILLERIRAERAAAGTKRKSRR